MDITPIVGHLHEAQADALIIYLLEGTQPQHAAHDIDAALDGRLTELIEAGDFTGKTGEIAVLYPHGALPAKRVIVVGLGPADKMNPDNIRRAVAQGMQKARSLNARHAATMPLAAAKFGTEIAVQAMTEGAVLGLYTYRGKKSSETPEALPEKLSLYVADDDARTAAERGISVGYTIAEGVTLARDLVNTPPNICTPGFLADAAQKAAQETGMKCDALERKQIEALRMGALLGVAQGSETPPRFIILEHNADKTDLKTVVLVGKAVTFDTGGYSMKTFDGMSDMKGDMAGGAAVIGAMQAIARLSVPLHVVGLIPSTDNMISGNAYRPQEVLTASNGVTIEIISTDAEGRLLLADALAFAARYNPSAVVDIATLTGSSAIALGGVASSLFVTDDTLKQTLYAAANETHERLWQMPMYPEFDKLIESSVADIKNSGGRYGGASIAALFLQHFVSYPAWAHIDMAHTEFNAKDNPYVPEKGATGYGVRLLTEFVRRWAAS